jgi:hypothetical protein
MSGRGRGVGALRLSLLLVAIQGCSSVQSSKFKLSDVGDGQGAIAGTLGVRFNGVPMNEDCKACFKEGDVCVEPDRDGYVFHHLAGGTNAFSAIGCSGQEYRFSPHRFHVTPKAVTYFGSLFVDWRADDHAGVGYAFGIIGAAIEEANRENDARLEVRDDHDAVFRRFARQTGSEGPFYVSLADAGEVAAPAE